MNDAKKWTCVFHNEKSHHKDGIMDIKDRILELLTISFRGDLVMCSSLILKAGGRDLCDVGWNFGRYDKKLKELKVHREGSQNDVSLYSLASYWEY